MCYSDSGNLNREIWFLIKYGEKIFFVCKWVIEVK